MIVLTNCLSIVLSFISFFIQAGGPIPKAHFVLDDSSFKEVL